MKSYLSLIPISAKVHRRQNRMTILCIIFAVFLVTAVFSITDICAQMERRRLLAKHGTQALQNLKGNAMVMNYFMAAMVLFVLILIAGVLMISSSLNSNVAQRTKFFGMMRCIGMSRQQIIRFVRLEALNWCKTAIPAGVALGIVIAWGLCAVLRFIVGEEFSDTPLFAVSPIGIVSGILMGLVTVLIAASSPAKRASKVSPITAVSGNSECAAKRHRGVNRRFFKIETALGIHHAVSMKKNLFLMTGSFALSIILFLSFSVLIELVGHIMPQLSSASDVHISSNGGSNSIDCALLDQIRGMDGVKRVFGRRNLLGVPANFEGKDGLPDNVDLISFDDFDLSCLKKDGMLKKGSDIKKVYGDSGYALAIGDPDMPLKAGDYVQIGGNRIEIAGMLKYNLFRSDGESDGNITLITSGETFERLTGVTGYSLVLIQTTKDATDQDVAKIQNCLGGNHTFSDDRDQRTSNTYAAFVLSVYGFLTVIALVTVLNIMNSISMSVTARIRQYGAMRAVGMDERQITKMIAAEAFTYALSGCAVGCAAGLFASKQMYGALITSHFSYAVWSFPVRPIIIILFLVLFAASAAVYAPAKRIRNISVTETINEL